MLIKQLLLSKNPTLKKMQTLAFILYHILYIKINAAIAAAIDSAIQGLKVSLEETKNDFEELVKLSNETIAALNSRIDFLENATKFII